MQRTPSICALFASLLCACVLEPEPEPGPETSTNGNCEAESSIDVQVPQSEVDAVLDAEGNVVLGGCAMLCTDAEAFGELQTCEVLSENSMEAGGTGGTGTGGTGTGGSSGGGPGDTGEPGGSTGGGDDSASADEGAGTTGADSGMADTVGNDPLITVRCNFTEYVCGIGGRGHEALRSRPDPAGHDRLGAWLAATAHSEAASVTAFLALSEELAAHGAPARLVERARAAAMDEVQHAEVMTRLAQDRGAAVTTPRFDPLQVRDLATIATENAVEGCVRETWAALEASHQARKAADPELRHVMAGIAEDETRHAQFSHDLDRWLRAHLDDEAVARVDAARRRAADELLASVQGQLDPQLRAQAGLPSATTARRLCTGLREQLWN